MTDLATVQVWDLFIVGHLARVGRWGLPDPVSPQGLEFYGRWQAEFVRLGLELADAEAASDRMARRERPFPGDHLATLVKHAEAARGARRLDADHRGRVVDRAARDRAKAAWDAMDEAARAELLAEVEREHPELDRVFRRWPAMRVAACYEHIRERSEVG